MLWVWNRTECIFKNQLYEHNIKGHLTVIKASIKVISDQRFLDSLKRYWNVSNELLSFPHEKSNQLTTNTALGFIRIISTSVSSCAENSSRTTSSVPAFDRAIFVGFFPPVFSFTCLLWLVTPVATINNRVAESMFRYTSSVMAFEPVAWTFYTKKR